MTNRDFIHFPPIGNHGVIGDRRTAALVAADGTIDWCCIPDYDGDIIFGAILDPDKGGYCRLGPPEVVLGSQTYERSSMCLQTRWDDCGGLLLTDFMPWPDIKRPQVEQNARVILRRIRATGGDAPVRFVMRPRWNFGTPPRVEAVGSSVRMRFPDHRVSMWTSFRVETGDEGVSADFTLAAGADAWVMIGLHEEPEDWNAERCACLHRETNAYWRDWAADLKRFDDIGDALEHCAMVVHLLAQAPHNAAVAAVTTSLPERIGGDRNYDYRYTWVRDASISAAFLTNMGEHGHVAEYFRWLTELVSEIDAPLHVCYRVNGGTDMEERERGDIAGYRGSKPVRFGNRACHQHQLGSLGWFADSALIYLKAGGTWRPEFWNLLRRSADHVCQGWRRPDSGVWELVDEAHFVASKVMAWVALDRALDVADALGETPSPAWADTHDAIRADVLTQGWCEERNAFRQRYDSDAIDAATLLIPIMNFLPPDDPRVLGTIRAIEDELVIDGLVHRFNPSATFGGEQLAVGDYEGAFLPATFWYARALAGAGRVGDARKVLRRCEEISNGPGIFAEAADARRNEMLGNTPLLFSQVEYGRALLAIHHAHLNETNDHE